MEAETVRAETYVRDVCLLAYLMHCLVSLHTASLSLHMGPIQNDAFVSTLR